MPARPTAARPASQPATGPGLPPAVPPPGGQGWPRLASRLGVRHRVATLGLVGLLMCALPLWQVLRHQGHALGATEAAQAALNPLGIVVALQRGVLRHRDVAGAVLRGAVTREPERLLRQRVVNERLTDLETALRVLDHPRAVGEGEALRADWTLLSRRIEERSLAAADSDAAHRLLVEQALQVIDYLSVAAVDLGSLAGPHASGWLQPVLHTLPRLSVRLGLLASAAPGSAESHPREFAAAQRRLAQVLGELRTLPAADDATPGLDQALRTVQAQADRYFDMQRHSAPAPDLQAAALALSEAQAGLQQLALQQLDGALSTHAQALRHQRLALLAAVGLLAALGTLLVFSLLPAPVPGRRRAPGLRRFDAAAPAQDTRPPGPDPAERRQPAPPPGSPETRSLLQRLRTPGTPARLKSDTLPSHTLPPVD